MDWIILSNMKLVIVANIIIRLDSVPRLYFCIFKLTVLVISSHSSPALQFGESSIGLLKLIHLSANNFLSTHPAVKKQHQHSVGSMYGDLMYSVLCWRPIFTHVYLCFGHQNSKGIYCIRIFICWTCSWVSRELHVSALWRWAGCLLWVFSAENNNTRIVGG